MVSNARPPTRSPARRSALTCGLASLKTLGASDASHPARASETSGVQAASAAASAVAKPMRDGRPPSTTTVTPTSPSRGVEPRAEVGRRRLDRDGHGHGRGGGHRGHLLLDAGELGDARDERLELEAREDVAHGLGIHRLHFEVLRADGQLDVAQQAVERAVATHVVEVLAQVAADDAGDLVGVLEQRVERAELAEPLDRGLLADLGHAGQVVARLADERGDVGVLLGRHAVALDDGLRGRSA